MANITRDAVIMRLEGKCRVSSWGIQAHMGRHNGPMQHTV